MISDNWMTRSPWPVRMPDEGLNRSARPAVSMLGNRPVNSSLCDRNTTCRVTDQSHGEMMANPDFVIFAVETTVLLTYSDLQRTMIYALDAETEIVLARHIFVYSNRPNIR